MAKQNLMKLLLALAVIILISGLMVQIRPRFAKANLPDLPANTSELSQVADAAPIKCMECHHSALLSRIDQLTTDPTPDLRPAWSPDGTRLAFYSGRSGNDDIWAINVDGSGEAQLTDDLASDRRPAWSPDGTKIVFDSDRGGSHDIWIMNADGSDQKQLTTSPGEEMFASFSPDGSRIIFYGYQGGRNNIWTMDTDGSNLKSLTNDLADENQSQCTFACHTPAYSPDGNTIAYHADNNGIRNIWVMDADGKNPRQLTTTSSNGDINNYLPSWSPDGRIIFQAEKPVALTIRTDIRMINPDGSDEVTLFAEVAHGGPFIWSPDGTRVALHSQRGGAGNFDIFVATFGEAVEEEGKPAQTDVPPQVAMPEKEGAGPDEVAPSSEAASETPVTLPLEFTPIAAVAGVSLVLILVGVGIIYGLRKLRRD